MKPLTWKRETIGLTEAAWVARHKEGDIEFELYVSDGAHCEPGQCDSDASESVWHAWLVCGDDVEQADVWMDETGCGPTNLPEACARAAQYLLDEMTPQATDEQIALARGLSIIDDTEVSVDDDARAYPVEDGFYVSSWLFVPDAETCGLCQSKEHGDDECPHDDEATDQAPESDDALGVDPACEVCDAVDHATDAHVNAGGAS